MILSNINSQSVRALLTFDQKICILTGIKLIISKIDMFQQFYAVVLRYSNPQKMVYSQKSKQILITSKNSIQIYNCQTINEITLKKVIALNSQIVKSLKFNGSWQMYGELYQYAQQNINFHYIESDSQQIPLALCYTEHFQIFIKKDQKLYVRNLENNIAEQIKWSERLMIIKNVRQNLRLNGILVGKQNFIVSISQKYGLVIINNKATTFQFSQILLIDNGFLIGMTNQHLMKVIKINNKEITDYGLVEPYEGIILAVVQLQQIIYLALFFQKAIYIQTISIVNYQSPKKQKMKKLLKKGQIPSTIFEQENQTQIKPSPSAIINFQNKASFNRNAGPSITQFVDQIDKNKQDSLNKGKQDFLHKEKICQQIETQKINTSNQKTIQIKDALQAKLDITQQSKFKEKKVNEKQDSPLKQEIMQGQRQNIKCQNFEVNTQKQMKSYSQSQQQQQSNTKSLKSSNPQLIQQFQRIETEEVTLQDLKQDYSNRISKDSNLSKKFKIGEDISEIRHVNSPSSDSQKSFDNFQEIDNQQEDQTIELKQQIQNNDDIFYERETINPDSILKHLQDQPPHIFNAEQHLPYTPAFMNFQNHEHIQSPFSRPFNHPQIQIRPNDEWGSLANKCVHVQDHSATQKSNISEKQKGNFSKKVIAFSDDPSHLTKQNIEVIQKKKYIPLMKELYEKSEEQFNQCLTQFLQQIIRQNEARLFFADYIRTFSQQKTKDTLIRLYSSIQNNQQNRINMSKALSQFKLNQIPIKCLPIDKEIINIYRVLYPSVYIQDLLNPNVKIIQLLLQNYFKQKNLASQIIQIQDQIIDITHPRNILNIILYLNDFYGFSMEAVFSIYCTQLIKNQCCQIIQKMVNQQKTFEICGVDPQILNEIIEDITKQMLQQSFTNLEYVQKTIHLLKGEKQRQLLLMLNAIDYLNFRDIFFNLQAIFKLKLTKQIFIFLKSIIFENNGQNLLKLKICELYKNLYFICYQQILTFYNLQLTQISQILAEKLVSSNHIKQGFELLFPILKNVKRGFIAKLIVNYFGGKLVNRLSNQLLQRSQNFIVLFPQFLLKQKSNANNISRDQLIIPKKSTFLLCKWEEFSNLYDQTISCQVQQVKLICYEDFLLALQLPTYGVIQKKQWKYFYEKIKRFLPLDFILKNNELTKIKFQNKILIPCQSQQQTPLTISAHRQTSLNVIQKQFNLNSKIKSLNITQHKEENQNNNNNNNNSHKKAVYRSKTDERAKFITNQDPVIESLIIQVEHETIIQILKELYEQSMKRFIEALSVVDRERVAIFNYKSFKSIINLNLDFQVTSILPFQIFLVQNKAQCFEICSDLLWSRINIRNALTICMIMQMMFKKGKQASLVFVHKTIQQQKNDALLQVIQKNIQRFNYTKGQIQEIQDICQQNGMSHTRQHINRIKLESRQNV